jgi:cytochrome c peroxidase
MKKTFTILIFFVAIVGVFIFLAANAVQEQPIEKVKAQYLADLEGFALAIQDLKSAANDLNESEEQVKTLQTAHLNARLAFKKFEYLLSYLDPEAVRDFLNGAPLLSFERSAPSLSILNPEGLQILDEMIFSDEIVENKAEIIKKINTLVLQFTQIQKFQQRQYFNDRQIFEATRFQLIRILTLGITGFDTPGSLNAIPEAKVSFEAMQMSFLPYLPYLEKVEAIKIDNLFSNSILYLTDNQDFESFDRLIFIKKYLNPLYAAILKAHQKLGLETINEVTTAKQSVNYFANNIFAEDFLNPRFYLQLDDKTDTKEVIELGRTLFFDPILSTNNERACASCHNPKKGFTDGKLKSTALDFKGTLDRNAPTLLNSVYAERFFYDLRAEMFDQQVDHVVVNEKEFHTNYKAIFEKLNQSKEYQQLFQASFGHFFDDPINKNTITTALSAYVKSLSSFNSDFDKYIRGETATYSEAAARGFNLFMGKATCGTCHFAPTFSGLVPPHFQESESEVLGVPSNLDTIHPVLDADLGRFDNKKIKEKADHFRNAFKTVTVRNVAITAPYMHNGIYGSLEEVVQFYNRGGGTGIGLDVPNQTLSGDALGLTRGEINDIVIFMETLTDTTGLTEIPKYLPAFEDKKLNKRTIGGKY